MRPGLGKPPGRIRVIFQPSSQEHIVDTLIAVTLIAFIAGWIVGLLVGGGLNSK